MSRELGLEEVPHMQWIGEDPGLSLGERQNSTQWGLDVPCPMTIADCDGPFRWEENPLEGYSQLLGLEELSYM